MALSVEDVRRIFRGHAAPFAASSRALQERLLAVYLEASQSLVAVLQRYAGRDPTFTATFYASVLGQVREAAAQLAVDLGNELDAGQRATMELAQAQLAARLAALSGHFEGTVRAFSVRPIEILLQSSPWTGVQTWEVLQTVRDASSQTLAGALLERARTSLAVSLAAREPLLGAGSAQARLQRSLNLNAYRAEVTARTEHARAYNLATHTELVEENAAGGDYRKTAIVTHDQRTDDDSLWLERWLAEEHGGSLALDEPFRDGDGRVYLHPPGRPNDREVECPWRLVWGGMDAVNLLTGGPRGLIF